MKVTGKIEIVRQLRRKALEASWGFVPTMGFLHEGHLELVRRARQENNWLAVSIYVNPTQFSPGEDLDRYPRDLDRDIVLLEDLEVDLLFTPDDNVMYPADFQTRVEVLNITQHLEGRSRPTHFQGVTTIVTKLFNIIQPTRAYFGQKDAQQAAVIRQLVKDLNLDLELVICPIVREKDGLAMSSRNVRLNPEQRAAATILIKTLRYANATYLDGETDAELIRRRMRQMIKDEELARLDYVSVAEPETLEELSIIENSALLSLAVYFGEVRLIDNILIK